jgi:hypothetical protein
MWCFLENKNFYSFRFEKNIFFLRSNIKNKSCNLCPSPITGIVVFMCMCVCVCVLFLKEKKRTNENYIRKFVFWIHRKKRSFAFFKSVLFKRKWRISLGLRFIYAHTHTYIIHTLFCTVVVKLFEEIKNQFLKK